ncbi:hypothetical protein E2493_14790 [Sphingomonas parva]|uniref:Uncharacterized protein n=1 Tax=Sphingomonas parva TaxID=2555898 RepID=A0A4Y8ZN58_9SPHN|nr:hypothetical protein [Sphingomonas parva]TFI57473.1 hypothetical protein E2493_14790 [Sphingomonas parva]
MHNDDPRYLRQKAEQCRRLARGCNDPTSARVLTDMAAEYDARARAALFTGMSAPPPESDARGAGDSPPIGRGPSGQNEPG